MKAFKNSPQPYMQAADIFVLASRREAFGLVLVEARQVGCAIIASEVDGIPEALDHGAAGILFPPSDIPALTRHLVRLLTDDLERKALAAKGSFWEPSGSTMPLWPTESPRFIANCFSEPVRTPPIETPHDEELAGCYTLPLGGVANARGTVDAEE